MTYLISLLTYVLINVVDAYTDRRIVVNHKRGAIVYALICAVIAWPLTELTAATWLDVCVLPLITRLAFFDPVFYLLKGKYRGIFFEEVKKINGSWIDDLEKSIGLPVIWARIIYLLIYVLYLIFFYA